MRVDGHDHAHHHHGVAPDADRRRLAAALALILAFMAAEVVAGLLSGSLALLSDAAHMITDAGSIGLALVAARLAARPPSAAYTFGLGRAEILSAQANGAALLVLAGIIAVEAVQRLISPGDVEGLVVVVVGLVGACVNVAAAWQLARAERRSLNVEGARAHVLTDLVALLMVRSGWGLLRDAGRVLLEGSPEGVRSEDVGQALASHPGVVEVHDLHVWEVTSGFPALAAHVMVEPGDDCHARRRELDRLVHDRFGIVHTTLQVDHAPREALLEIEPRRH
jgi:cobalt-zinc-cadmium efflux system protein